MNVMKRLAWMMPTLLVGCTPQNTVDGLYDGLVDVRPRTVNIQAAIPEGDTVNISYQTFKDNDQDAVVTIAVQHVVTQEVIIVATDQPVPEGRADHLVPWDTNGVDPGSYAVTASLTSGETVLQQRRAPGTLTVDGRPSFEFTAPTEDATIEGGGRLVLSWIGSDPEGSATAQVGIDTDTDHASGNEIYISGEFPLPTTEEAFEDIQEWNAADQDGEAVPAGTYNLFAIVNDDVNDVQIIEGLGQITIP